MVKTHHKHNQISANEPTALIIAPLLFLLFSFVTNQLLKVIQ